MQQSYNKGKSKTISDLINNEFNFNDEDGVVPSLDDLYKTYKERLDKIVPDSSGDFGLIEEFDVDCAEFNNIKSEEVEKAINNTKKNSAPGVDGWKLTEVIKLSKTDICAIFNKRYLDGTPREANGREHSSPQ